jgi:hypothetical protein
MLAYIIDTFQHGGCHQASSLALTPALLGTFSSKSNQEILGSLLLARSVIGRNTARVLRGQISHMITCISGIWSWVEAHVFTLGAGN